MAIPKATNFFVYLIQDAVEKQMGGLIIPDKGRVKPNRGEVFSIGGKVTDPEIKKGKGQKALFHSGAGFTIEVDGIDYLVLEENQIIGVI